MWYQNQNSSSIWTCNRFVDIPEIVANIFVKKIWSKGYILSSEKAEINTYLKKFEQKNDLLEFFVSNEKHISISGTIKPFLTKTKTGDVYINIADPYFVWNSRVAQTNRQVISASIYSRQYHDDFTFSQLTEYSPTEIKRSLYSASVKDNKVIIGAQITEIPKSLQENYQTTANPFKFVPVWDFQNLPREPLPGRDTMNFYTDTQPVSNLINTLQWTILQYIKELQFNKTRIVGSLPSSDQQKYLNKANTDANNIFSDNSLDFRDDFFIFAQIGAIGGNGAGIEVMEGDPKLAQYITAIQDLWTMILKGVGLGEANDGGGTYKNEIGAITDMGDAESTISLKKNLRQKQYMRILDAVLIDAKLWDGEGDRPYTFEIRDTGAINSIAVVENQILQLQNGLTDKVRAFSKINGVSLNESIEAMKSIDANNEAEHEKEMERQGDLAEATGQIDNDTSDEGADNIKDKEGE